MTTASQEIREIRQEMKHLAQMVKEASASANGHSNIIGFDRKDLQKMARQAGKTIRGYVDEKTHQADELRQTCEETITTHPFKSVLTAVLGGVVLGAILGRK